VTARSALRVAVVVNPRSSAPRRLGAGALAALRERSEVVGELATQGDASDGARLAQLLASAAPDVLVAAGGDGTVGLALRALLETRGAERPALGFLPLGTGNNAARSFGLRALRGAPSAALDLALAALVCGPRRAVDVGLAGGRPFLGSFTLGMDADVLALRNRLVRRLGRSRLARGYGLYAFSILVNLMRGARGTPARLWLDGERELRPLHNLAVINAPIYAGPLRLDGANDCADGLLDVHATASAAQYLLEIPSAWRRHLRVQRGVNAAASSLLRRAREVRVELDRPVAAQADGEEIGAAASFRVVVRPRAVRVCTPPSARDQRGA